MSDSKRVSMSVVRRLPRYYRFLLELKNSGVYRISSQALAERMGTSASQVRQDLNCFGGFGHQGFGYDVPKLFDGISGILGLNQQYSAVLLGVGNLGRAVVNHVKFESWGFRLTAIFDSDPRLIGTEINGLTVLDTASLEEYCRTGGIDAAVLCIPKENVEASADILYRCGVRCFWNFSHYDLSLKYRDVIAENVHFSDSLMTLCYRMTAKHPMTRRPRGKRNPQKREES
jgi:AT-rich DNA-binding protein